MKNIVSLLLVIFFISGTCFGSSTIRDSLTMQYDSFRCETNKLHGLLGNQFSSDGTISVSGKKTSFLGTGRIDTGIPQEQLVGSSGEFTAFIVLSDINTISQNWFYSSTDVGGDRFYLFSNSAAPTSLQVGIYDYNPTISGILDNSSKVRVICTTYSNGTASVYLDGELLRTSSGVTPLTNSNTLVIGSRKFSAGYGDHSNYHFSIFNRGLALDQIRHQSEKLKQMFPAGGN